MLVPAIVPLLSDAGEMVILVKPQFEAGRDEVGKGGIIRDPELHRAACRRVTAAVEALGFRAEIVESPILGAEGNREFLLYARR
jgi:23S rRNA (cytidine1920-2'-O)/16S rRNA (cytidine1409-2'-O)-methyltransferase